MSDSPSENQTFTGSCFCRSVTYRVTGKPVMNAYCHCTICQRFNASPFIHTIHFPMPNFTWTHPAPIESSLEYYQRPAIPWNRLWHCRKCGANIASCDDKMERWCIRGSSLDRNNDGRIIGWEFLKPTAHIFYGTRVLDIIDDLPKWEGHENKSNRLD